MKSAITVILTFTPKVIGAVVESRRGFVPSHGGLLRIVTEHAEKTLEPRGYSRGPPHAHGRQPLLRAARMPEPLHLDYPAMPSVNNSAEVSDWIKGYFCTLEAGEAADRLYSIELTTWETSVDPDDDAAAATAEGFNLPRVQVERLCRCPKETIQKNIERSRQDKTEQQPILVALLQTAQEICGDEPSIQSSEESNDDD